MPLLNVSDESETRILSRIGTIVVLAIVLATFSYLMVNPFGQRSRDVISLAIDTPYIGQGVAAGTPVIMHGVTIGHVVSVSNLSGGGVRLETDLQQRPTRGLTDAMGIDYRPSNYFGVTGINVIPEQTGRPLRSGMRISITPKSNSSLQTLIYRLGELSNGVLNQRLFSVIERATRYADGLNPLLETVLIVGTSVAKVQTVSTARLLRNTAGVSTAFPGFIDALLGIGDDCLHTYVVDFDPEKFNQGWRYWNVLPDIIKKTVEDAGRYRRENTEEWWHRSYMPTLDTARVDLFSRVGYLEASHSNDLFPILESVRAVADAVPKIVRPESFAYTITELRQRFERMYAGSGDQRAVQVRIILDRLPGVAAPLGVVMGGSS